MPTRPTPTPASPRQGGNQHEPTERRWVVLPGLPPALNNLYPTGRDGRRHLSAEGRQWHRTVADACTAARLLPFPQKRVYLSVHLEFVGLNYASDVDGRAKAVLDALADALGFDDRYVEELTLRRVQVLNMPRLRETRAQLVEVQG